MDVTGAELRVARTLDAVDRGSGFFDVGANTYRLAKLVSGGHNTVYAVRAVRQSDGIFARRHTADFVVHFISQIIALLEAKIPSTARVAVAASCSQSGLLPADPALYPL